MKLLKLETLLTQKFGWDWCHLETETLSLEIGALFDELTVAQISTLKAIHLHHDVLLHDADYFLRFVEVANGHLPDPHHHDIPTSLELDYALKQLEEICEFRKLEMQKTNMFSNVILYVVNNEGHGSVATDTLAKYSGLPKVGVEFAHAYEKYASEIGDS